MEATEAANGGVLLTGRTLLLSPSLGRGPIWRSHFQLPIPHVLSESSLLLVYSGRDALNRSHGFRARIDMSTKPRVAEVATVPLLYPGGPGAFDEQGAMPSSLLSVEGNLWMYYIGWARAGDLPFRTEIGLAISSDGGSNFERVRETPVFPLQDDEPFAVSQPIVWQTSDGFEMIYSSVREWRHHEGKLEPRYLLRRARSRNGHDWHVDARPVLGFASDDEGGFSRATILRQGDSWHMMYGFRSWRDYREAGSGAYRLGYATSLNGGDSWIRGDGGVRFAESAEPSEWDRMMQSYPALLAWGDDVYCFYSGNGFGQAGIGYSKLSGGMAALQAERMRSKKRCTRHRPLRGQPT